MAKDPIPPGALWAVTLHNLGRSTAIMIRRSLAKCREPRSPHVGPTSHAGVRRLCVLRNSSHPHFPLAQYRPPSPPHLVPFPVLVTLWSFSWLLSSSSSHAPPAPVPAILLPSVPLPSFLFFMSLPSLSSSLLSPFFCWRYLPFPPSPATASPGHSLLSHPPSVFLPPPCREIHSDDGDGNTWSA